MRVLMYSDLHVSHRNVDYMRFLEGTIQYLEEMVKTHAPDFLVNLGDTLDSFGIMDVRDGSVAQDLLCRLTRGLPEGSKHIVLRGNHDTYDKFGDLSSTGLIAPKDIIYVSKNQVLKIDSRATFLCIPHTKDVESANQFIYNNAEKGCAIFAHMDFLGCRLTPAYVSKDGIDPAKMDKHKLLIFSGHYHAPMTVGCVNFVGAPLYQDFRDLVVEEPRGFLLWERNSMADVHQNVLRRIPNPHTYQCIRVEAKTKKTLTVACEKYLPEAERIRVKVYVPKKLIEDAQDLFKGFLWYGVYPLEGEKEGMEFTSKVNLRTTSEEAVKKAVSSAGEEFNKAVLEQYGMDAFKGSL